MTKFEIDTRKNEMGEFTVDAETPEAAAALAVGKMFPKRRMYAWRVTGEPGGGGLFQAYNKIGNQGMLSSTGYSFHVSY